ncbi:glycosyltransferase family A protein [Shimia aestuarii]|uniref:Glycosyl transferase family 2 n=1 Tax=Shimia aestuarii TaxID=254406 RepID=A0A1I4TX58_9RHOB|nr:glycosyltransferase family A protein [Shimia aestuarii]SFM81131.1 Glycosyl transferase family 2 [Shimia aestuarii]
MSVRNYSFVIPAYNDAQGLKVHLKYFSSRPENIQLVIVDDCSDDNTADIIQNASLPDNITLTYHRQQTNGGPALARNTGRDLVTGDYVMFLDADDLLSDYFFDYIALAPLENGADFALFKYHLARSHEQRYSYEMHQVDATFFTRIEHAPFPMGTVTLEEMPSALNTVNFPWNKIYRRDFLERADIRFPDLRMHEDIPPHWHSFMRSKRFSVLGWAPPLITHYEIEQGTRATNYIGERRMGVFPLLHELHKELGAHPLAEKLLPEFDAFCHDMFAWMTDTLCARKDKTSREWRKKYKEEIDLFQVYLETGEHSSAQKNQLPSLGRLQRGERGASR